MGKHKNSSSHHKKRPPQPQPNPHDGAANPSKKQKGANGEAVQSKFANGQQRQKVTVPFGTYDRILLVGEGDFSFAHSLLSTHGCSEIVATCFDSEEGLLHKYPQATDHIRYIEGEDQEVLYGIDATKLSQHKQLKRRQFDRIVFNFPHVGGKSTDVNRQVRYNQSLLVDFFKACIPLLSSAPPSENEGGDTLDQSSVLVTLFESHPYTLWNVRDLARHVGLSVARSFRFVATEYPEYRHARTLGNIIFKRSDAESVKNTDGDEDEVATDDKSLTSSSDNDVHGETERKRPGAWRGEERPARTYEFVRGNQGQQSSKAAITKKRASGSESDSD